MERSFKKFSRYNKYKTKDNLNRIIYKCINTRKNEKLRIETKQKSFCNATIECIINPLDQKNQYRLIKEHSEECENLIIKKDINTEKNLKNSREEYIKECECIMNSSNIYDRKIFKEEFKKLYNSKNHDFPLNNNFLFNIITKWKHNSNRFTKYSVLENKFDYNNHTIFREFRSILVENEKNNYKNLEYIIWVNDENLHRIRKSRHLYIDGTFHHPKEFNQMLIIMYKDIITDLKRPGIYILINGKYKAYYDIVFDSIMKILTNNGKYELKINSIVTYSEKALMDMIVKYFPSSQRIARYFHYIQDLIRNLKTYGLYKNSDTNLFIKELGRLPFSYNGDMKKLTKILENIIKNYPLYENFINNYFYTNKIEFFKDNSLNYNLIPDDCRTNNYLGFIKRQLGKNRIINLVNFIHFIKTESERSLDKLLSTNNKSINCEKNYFKMNEEIKEKEININIEKNSNNNDINNSIKSNNNIK